MVFYMLGVIVAFVIFAGLGGARSTFLGNALLSLIWPIILFLVVVSFVIGSFRSFK